MQNVMTPAVSLPPDLSFLNMPQKRQLASRSPVATVATVEKPFFVEVAAVENEEPMAPSADSTMNRTTNEPGQLNTAKTMQDFASDTELIDSLPFHEQPVVVSMPFLPIAAGLFGEDEFRNRGSLCMETLFKRAESVFQNGSIEFESGSRDEQRLPPLEECIGVLFSLSSGMIFIDDEIRNSFPDFDIYSDICSVLDASYEPIYVLTKTHAHQVSAQQFLDQYRSMFSKKKEGEE